MRIFLVDDDDIFNTLHEATIRMYHPDVDITIFKTGEELIRFIRNTEGYFNAPDIMFLDIRMPDMDGFAFLDAVQSEFPNAFEHSDIYMLSSTLNEKDLERARNFALVKDFISKPLLVEDYQSMVNARQS